MKAAGNVPASVRQRLLNLARRDKRPFNELLQDYAMERFLYRLSLSSCADRFILKGALMLRAWRSPEIRPTMDIDMLGRTSNEESSIVEQIRGIMAVEVDPDGLVFSWNGIAHQSRSFRRYLHQRQADPMVGFLQTAPAESYSGIFARYHIGSGNFSWASHLHDRSEDGQSRELAFFRAMETVKMRE